MPNATKRYVKKLPEALATPKAVDPDALAVFKANLPIFRATIRGNVVADGETFEAKSGRSFYSFRIAYNRAKDKPAMFIKVLFDGDLGFKISKGNYVEVSGDYSDELGAYNGGPTIHRTLFMSEGDICRVLIG